METPKRTAPHTRGRGARPWLILVKLAGLGLFFGGLAALASIGMLGLTPSDQAGWLQHKATMRAVFLPCVLGGLGVAVLMGIALFLQHPRVFARMRWFRVKAGLLVVCLPGLHLWARGRVMRFYDAIEAGQLDALPSLQREVTVAFVVAIVVMLGIAALGKLKPRLGEAIGTRDKRV